MRHIKVLGRALVAMLAVGGVVASTASAREFKSTELGALEAEAVTNQEFTTAIGTFTCTKLKLLGTSTTSLLTEVQEATVDYGGCTAFGFFELKVTPALYDISANETLNLLNKITLSAPADNCTILVPAQSNLKTVKYDNIERNAHKGIELLLNVSGLLSSGEGDCAYAEEKIGTYKGSSFVWLEKGGTLTWG